MIDLNKNDSGNTSMQQTDEELVNQIYAFAANLLFEEKRSKKIVLEELVRNGLNEEMAKTIVNNLISEYNKGAKKDMLYGSLWCIGGTIGTIANIGFIFWGAIVFGAIQFIKGLISLR